MKKLPILPALLLTLTAGQCGGDNAHVVDPGERVVYVNVYKEVPRPCPVKKPVRPGKLARPLPEDPAVLATVLMAKLLEWAGPGKYADQADSAIEICTRPVPPDGTPVTP